MPSPNPTNPLTGAPVTTLPGKSYTATAYCSKFGAGSINGGGVTADGTDLRDGKQRYIIAAGPGSGLSMGDRVHIEPNPFAPGTVFKVADHGGAIVGHHIDIYVADCAKANAWGHRSVTVAQVTGSSSEGPPTGAVIPNPFSPITDIAGFLGKLNVIFSRQFWLRVLLIGGGGLLMAVALVAYARSATIGEATKLVGGAVTGNVKGAGAMRAAGML